MNSSDKEQSQFTNAMKTNRKERPISSGEKIMIVNYYKSIIMKNNKMKFCDIISFISKSLRVKNQIVNNIISEYISSKRKNTPVQVRQIPCVVDKINDFDHNSIRRKIHSFWLNKELPTFSKILSAINEDKSLPEIKNTSLRIALKNLNFKFSKHNSNSILMERNKLVSWRRRYLRSICRFREEGIPIYYLDEMWLNTEDYINKVNVDNTVIGLKEQSTNVINPTDKGKMLIILHIGSADGFVAGGPLYLESKKNSSISHDHDELNDQTFKEWFEEILPLLKENSVIVMNNTPHRSVKSERIPTMSWKKTDIVNWLLSKDHKVDPTITVKNDLMEIVKRLKPKYNTYVIDEIAKKAGKSILRLPPYHNELNPIKLIWSKVKQQVKSNNTMHKIVDVQHSLLQAIDNVTPEIWQNFIDHVKTEEQKLLKIDFISDELTDKLQPKSNYVLSLGGVSDSSSDDDI